MARIALNKSSLDREKRNLKTFNRYLPTLELKRQQLLVERKKARDAVREVYERIGQIEKNVREQLPMLACEDIDIESPVRVTDVVLGKQNIVGTVVPVVEKVDVEVVQYSYLTKPHWMDFLVERLKEMVELHVEMLVRELRYQKISEATRITTQRVNLFSRILIPRSNRNIARIKIFMSDMERAAVVNARISKTRMAN